MMLEFTVQHNYCGAVKKVRGANVIDALKDNNLDMTIWTVLSVERVDKE